jgi:biopolymer transport protein ExbD
MRIRDDAGIADPEFNMAPLIDIVFQLLIFFMVATSYGKMSEKQIDVDLPTAQSGQKADVAPDEIVVDVLRDGQVFVAGKSVERGDLVAALSAAARGHDATPVTVRGDRLATHETVVDVLDACGIAGLSNLSIGTREPGAER